MTDGRRGWWRELRRMQNVDFCSDTRSGGRRLNNGISPHSRSVLRLWRRAAQLKFWRECRRQVLRSPLSLHVCNEPQCSRKRWSRAVRLWRNWHVKCSARCGLKLISPNRFRGPAACGVDERTDREYADADGDGCGRQEMLPARRIRFRRAPVLHECERWGRGTEVDQTPPVGWSDMVFMPNPGTVMDGSSFVV